MAKKQKVINKQKQESGDDIKKPHEQYFLRLVETVRTRWEFLRHSPKYREGWLRLCEHFDAYGNLIDVEALDRDMKAFCFEFRMLEPIDPDSSAAELSAREILAIAPGIAQTPYIYPNNPEFRHPDLAELIKKRMDGPNVMTIQIDFGAVRHPRQRRWLDEWGRLKGGRPV